MNIKTINRIYIPQLVTSSRYRIFRHVLLILIICFLMMNINTNGGYKYVYGVYIEKIVLFCVLGGTIYANLYLFVPRFLLQNKLGKYTFALVASTLTFLFSLVCFQLVLHQIDWEKDWTWLQTMLDLVGAFITIIIIVACSTACLVFRNWIVDNEKIINLKKATLDIELQQLKNQINPHFLFNMLNNANMLLKKDKKQASEILFKLEELLSYQMNDSVKDEVSLESEINFLSDYLNLEKVRRDCFEYSIQETGNCRQQKVTPLLFIIFVENAVKHNIDNEKPSYVKLSFNCWENLLEFVCENSKPEQEVKAVGVGGLGLKNIRRRLELLYPERHRMEIEDEKLKYTVKLTIVL